MNLNDIAIIIPSLNPDEKFVGVVDGMRSVGFSRFIMVDDGSDSDHKGPFAKFCDKPGFTLLVHDVNLGKGQALKDAFKYVAENLPEIEAVITIDGDGQHTPEDAVKLAQRLKEKPNEITFGCRDFDQPGVPSRNKAGNKITSKVFKWLFGMKLSDTQTGLRGFPRKYLPAFVTEVEGTRFEYESNMLLYMNDNKIPFNEVPIKTLYIEENKSSHFHPVKDSIRIYKPIIRKSTSLKYVGVALLSVLIDLVAFSILNKLFGAVSILPLQTFLTTGLARIISAVCNYAMNKKLVFNNKSSVKQTGIKYLVTAVCVYAASYFCCLGLFSLMAESGAVGLIRTLVKAIVDLLIFLLNYQVQKKWVFKK